MFTNRLTYELDELAGHEPTNFRAPANACEYRDWLSALIVTATYALMEIRTTTTTLEQRRRIYSDALHAIERLTEEVASHLPTRPYRNFRR